MAGTSPAVVLALTAAATSTIRLGSGAVQMGHRTALSTVEEFGLLDALHPGRFDLGLGRSGGRPREPRAPALAGGGAAATVAGGRTPNGLLIPPRFSLERLLGSPRFALQKTLLQHPHRRRRHPVPTPEQALRHVWSEADRELVADRIDTQFVGRPGQVADQLERLRDATEAGELIVTTITHDHADRVRSYELLPEEWARR